MTKRKQHVTKRIRSGLLELASIGDTILQAGGEGWALECKQGPDFGPCNKADCETCQSRIDLENAVAWLTDFLRP